MFGGSNLGAHLFEVEVALDAVEGLVADGAAIAQVDHGEALRPEHLATQAVVSRDVVAVDVGGIERVRQMLQDVLVTKAELADELDRYPGFVAQVVDAVEGRLGRLAPCQGLLALGPAVAREAEPAHERGQTQPLTDQRAEDDAERQENDQIARGEWVAGVGRRRQGEGRGEGDDTAQTGPSNDRDELPRG
jgi:hypothetical protein